MGEWGENVLECLVSQVILNQSADGKHVGDSGCSICGDSFEQEMKN